MYTSNDFSAQNVKLNLLIMSGVVLKSREEQNASNNFIESFKVRIPFL